MKNINFISRNAVSCVLCGKDDVTTVSGRGILHKSGELLNFSSVMCLQCGLVFINPRPSDSEYRELYRKYGETRHSLNDAQAIIAYARASEQKQKGEKIAAFLYQFLGSSSSVLDIGCGPGAILKVLKNVYGLEVSGIEPDTLIAETISKEYGFSIFAGTLDEFVAKNPGKKFAALIMHHVFEHFANPLEKLALFQNMLTDKGVMYIEVPNVIDFKKPYYQFFDILHLYNYSPTTLAHVLHKGGFKIVGWNRVKKWRLQIVAAKVSHPAPELVDQELNIKNIAVKTRWFLRKRYWLDKLFSK